MFEQEQQHYWNAEASAYLEFVRALAAPAEGAAAAAEGRVQPPPAKGRSVLGKRGHSSASGLPAYRGVSYHARTGRLEGHVWLNGKQMFLGSYLHPEMGALAYDLAAVALRGTHATTNFPLALYSHELAAAGQIPFEELVLQLREQAKAISRLDTSATCGQADRPSSKWELQLQMELGEAIEGHSSLGLYASEAQAAQAVDRALLARDGLAAADSLSFPLDTYRDCLDAEQLEAARRAGLLPQAVQRTCAPTLQHLPPLAPEELLPLSLSLPLPLPALAPIACPKPNADHHAASIECQPGQPEAEADAEAAAAAAGAQALAPPLPVLAQRKASVTPRGLPDPTTLNAFYLDN